MVEAYMPSIVEDCPGGIDTTPNTNFGGYSDEVFNRFHWNEVALTEEEKEIPCNDDVDFKYQYAGYDIDNDGIIDSGEANIVPLEHGVGAYNAYYYGGLIDENGHFSGSTSDYFDVKLASGDFEVLGTTNTLDIVAKPRLEDGAVVANDYYVKTGQGMNATYEKAHLIFGENELGKYVQAFTSNGMPASNVVYGDFVTNPVVVFDFGN